MKHDNDDLDHRRRPKSPKNSRWKRGQWKEKTLVLGENWDCNLLQMSAEKKWKSTQGRKSRGNRSVEERWCRRYKSTKCYSRRLDSAPFIHWNLLLSSVLTILVPPTIWTSEKVWRCDTRRRRRCKRQLWHLTNFTRMLHGHTTGTQISTDKCESTRTVRKLNWLINSFGVSRLSSADDNCYQLS